MDCLTIAREVVCEWSQTFLLLELQAGQAALLCFVPSHGKERQVPALFGREVLGFSQNLLCLSSVTAEWRVRRAAPSSCAPDCSRRLVAGSAVRMEWIYPGHKLRLVKRTKMSFKINCTSWTNRCGLFVVNSCAPGRGERPPAAWLGRVLGSCSAFLTSSRLFLGFWTGSLASCNLQNQLLTTIYLKNLSWPTLYWKAEQNPKQ